MPIGIYKPELVRPPAPAVGKRDPLDYELAHESDYVKMRDLYKPGKFITKKVTRTPTMPPGVYGPALPPYEEEIFSAEPGIRKKGLALNWGTPKGRIRQSRYLYEHFTPELKPYMEAKGGKRALEFFKVLPKIGGYAVAEQLARSAASMAIGGSVPLVLGPVVLGKRVYDAAYEWRNNYEIFLNSNKAEDTAGNRRKLRALNVAMFPFDVVNAVASKAIGFGANFLAGKTFLNRIPGQLEKLDAKLEGFKDTDGLNLLDGALNKVKSFSNLLTFGQPTVAPKPA